MRLPSILALAAVLPLTSCATIFTGSSEVISISSEPSGAEISLRTTGGAVVQTVVTPASVQLKKGKAYTIEAKLAGYKPATVLLDTSFQPWFLGNIICGGIIGIIIDIATGAYLKFDSDHVTIKLESAVP